MIRCSNIEKSFGKTKLFENYNLEIKLGEFVCIYGKSGSGKTTLLNMIGTLEKYDSGIIEYLINSKVYNAKQSYRVIRNEFVNYIFQNFALLQDKTVCYNLKFVMQDLKISKQEKLNKIKNELNKIGLIDKLDSFVYELSGGEQQRIALVRSLLKSGDILLADEPTGSLDETNKQIVMEMLVDMHRNGKTIVVVTHDDDFKKFATRVIEL